MTESTEQQQQALPGRLARVIATRGGLAPPEAPFVIEHREALIYMLCEAAELEHGIMCQYLFAAFSMKQDADEGLTDDQVATVRRWREQISHVAAQEMLHLALVQNLLSAIGAAPHLSRPNFPQPASHYPAGVHLTLLPFGEAALRHFMFLERPEGMALHDAPGLAAFSRAAPAMQARRHRAARPGLRDRRPPVPVDRGRHRAPRAEVRRAAGCSSARRAPRPRSEYFGWPELVAVTDVASAQRAIGEILEQGEGPRGDWRNAHFGQFVEILDEFEQLREADRGFDPVRPVLPLNVRPSERDPNVPLVTDPLAQRVMDLFNVCYEILLLMLQRFFAHTEETDAQLRALADGTYALMAQAIKPLGDVITRLPAGPEYPGQTAGPASSSSTRATTCCRTGRRPGYSWPSGSRRPPRSASRPAPGPPRRSPQTAGGGPRRRWPASPAPSERTCPPAQDSLSWPLPRRPRSCPPCSAAPVTFTERAPAPLPRTSSPRRSPTSREPPTLLLEHTARSEHIGSGGGCGGAHYRQRAAAARRPPWPGRGGGRAAGPGAPRARRDRAGASAPRRDGRDPAARAAGGRSTAGAARGRRGAAADRRRPGAGRGGAGRRARGTAARAGPADHGRGERAVPGHQRRGRALRTSASHCGCRRSWRCAGAGSRATSRSATDRTRGPGSAAPRTPSGCRISATPIPACR